jgi:hypothetical protein
MGNVSMANGVADGRSVEREAVLKALKVRHDYPR